MTNFKREIDERYSRETRIMLRFSNIRMTTSIVVTQYAQDAMTT